MYVRKLRDIMLLGLFVVRIEQAQPNITFLEVCHLPPGYIQQPYLSTMEIGVREAQHAQAWNFIRQDRVHIHDITPIRIVVLVFIRGNS
ncbi:hypothetical protein E4T56_gene4811 [Termitomyces sp. T112]|nr:hypothetical protein E4T56_gene4811 [Termitomyces sp. T112]